MTSCFFCAWEVYGFVQKGKCGGSWLRRVEKKKKREEWENLKEKWCTKIKFKKKVPKKRKYKMRNCCEKKKVEKKEGRKSKKKSCRKIIG